MVVAHDNQAKQPQGNSSYVNKFDPPLKLPKLPGKMQFQQKWNSLRWKLPVIKSLGILDQANMNCK